MNYQETYEQRLAHMLKHKMHHRDVRTLVEETEDWVIPEIISASTTLLYGQAKAGKSFLLCNLLNALVTNGSFLGREVPKDREFRPLVVWTDEKNNSEYCSRVDTVYGTADVPEVEYLEMVDPLVGEQWDLLRDVVLQGGHNFLIIDNLSGVLGDRESVNDDPTIRAFYRGLKKITRAGVHAVLVHHASDVFGSTRPAGSHQITAGVRWRIQANRTRRDNVTLNFMGNHAEPHRITVRHETGARFTVVDRKNADQLNRESDANEKNKAKQAKEKQTRTAESLDSYGTVAEWLRVNWGDGEAANAVAKRCAAAIGAEVGLSEATIKKQLTAKEGRLRQMLEK